MRMDAGMTREADSLSLEAARAAALASPGGTGFAGIGLYREKLLHATLKRYYQADTALHEVPLAGMVADLVANGVVYEIQTGGFTPLKEKIGRYLEAEQPVRVVCPLVREKWIVSLSAATGEAGAPRKSPRKGSFFDVLKELHCFLPYRDHPLFSVELLMLDVQEYRVEDRKKRCGYRRLERYPLRIGERLLLASGADWVRLLPPSLPTQFTAAAFRQATRLTPKWTARALWCLEEAEVVCRAGKRGRAILYERKSSVLS